MERFWSKVEKTDSCWLWKAAKYYNGYGAFNRFRKPKTINIGAHRMAWILTNGDIPNNLMVLHKCDRKDCVNPNHLFLGNQPDNMHDMIRKRRKPTKLTYEQVCEIRALHQKRLKLRQQIAELSEANLTKKFKISASVIRKITGGSVWNASVWSSITQL